ncbi:MAG TPA: SIMPL domain-containing protein [Gaiellaceae bacterium]|nr:SIMPL domain-containing protein [Gaiellaceae bacterium]
MNRFRTILLISGVLLVAAAIAGVAQPHLGRSATPSTGSTITVTGSGTVDSTPNQASFDFGVTTNGATAAQALSRNSAQARSIIDALKKAGIAAADIQTTQVSLWPQTSSNGQRITGYQASNSVNVTAAVGKSGQLVDAAVGAGANNVDGPNLDTADQTALYNKALDKALSDAKQKAQAIASATGLTLGTALKVHEGGASTPVVFAEATATPSRVAPPIEAGTQKIQASVTVTYSAGG